jgi:hypothetical protein
MSSHDTAFKCSIDPRTNDTESKCTAAGGNWDSYNSTSSDYTTLELGIFQQSFLGLSIMDWSSNLGFNGNGSSLTVNLVRDEFNTRSFLTPSGTRDAITEGYHSWNPDAFPKDMLTKYGIDTSPDSEPGNSEDGMGRVYSQSGDIAHMPDPGEPVFFHYYNGADLNSTCVLERNCDKAFSFPGILTKYEKRFSTSGLTYSVNIADPRTILENTIVILNGYASRVSPSDYYTVVDSNRTYEDGWNGYYNILNIYGYYEHHGFNKSDRTEAGMIWLSPDKMFNTDWESEKCMKNGAEHVVIGADCAADGGTIETNGGQHMFGILPALMEMTGGTIAEYQVDQEPFGGPMTYSVDSRHLAEKAPFAEIYGEDGLASHSDATQYPSTHRYLLDLGDFLNLSPYDPEWGVVEDLNGTEGFIPTDYRVPGDSMSLLQLIQQVCEVAASDFYVTLEPITKKLIERNYVLPQDYEAIKNYSGVIRVVVVARNSTITKDALSDAVDLSQKLPPEGPFVDVENNPTLVSSTLGYEFTDPVEGKILLGGPRTRVVGVTPIGDRKLRKELFYNDTSDKYLDMSSKGFKCLDSASDEVAGMVDETACLNEDATNTWEEVDTTEQSPAPVEGTDSILTEYLPNVELDGVTLTRQDIPEDTFLDGTTFGWNPYGKVGVTDKDLFPDFAQNLPPVSNDNYIPWYWPQDYSGDKNEEADPFQFNRVNSLEQSNAGDCVFSGNTPEDSYCKAPDGTNAGEKNETDCVAASSDYVWTTASSEDGCGEGGGSWTAKQESLSSGYLDIFPCWGYIEYEHTEGGAYKNLHGSCIKTGEAGDVGVEAADKEACEALGFDHKWVPDPPSAIQATDPLLDIVDNTVQGKPIKGFTWDDDPYRDFNPVEGIFSGIEWWNPSIGNCENKAGALVPAWENMPNICECNPDKSEEDSDCVTIRGGDKGLYIFRPHCIPWSACRGKDGGDIVDTTGGLAGSGNSVASTYYGCEFGCFDLKVDSNGDPLDPEEPASSNSRLVAYYTKEFTETGSTPVTYKKGDSADKDHDKWESNLKNGTVQLVASADDCAKSGTFLDPPVNRGSFRTSSSGGIAESATCDINATDNTNQTKCEQLQCEGDRGKTNAECTAAGKTWKKGKWKEGDENDYEGGGGLYSQECTALSFREEWMHGCFSTTEITGGDIPYPANSLTDAISPKDCRIKYPTAKWRNKKENEYPPQGLTDPYTGLVLEPEDIPAPGYVMTRQRLKGECHMFSETENDEGAIDSEDEGLPENPTNDPRECMARNSAATEDNLEANGKMVYGPIDLNTGIGLPLKCRTSTIPIDLGQVDYYGGPKPEHNDPGGQFQDFHYATVTELRHAATSKESWLIFMKELQPYLPCHMYHQDPQQSNAWGDHCPVKDNIVMKGGMSGSYIEAANALTGFESRGVSVPDTNPSPAKAKAVTGEPCGDEAQSALMTNYEKTSMMIDLAFKKVAHVATQFYGRKYLVPLPYNPPSTITCTNPSHKDKEACENLGFDWGAHGLQSEWFHKMGVGRCANGTSPDKYHCQIVSGDIWIEPIQEINRWEIATSAWPGGDIEFNFGSAEGKAINTGYPQNMNFWTDDGNLKSFVIFPEKEWQRFSGNSVPVSFASFDAETFYKTPFNAGPHNNWGGKVYVPTQVDPKTHWLTDRPDWEVHHELQYKKYLAGSPMELPKGGETAAQLKSLATLAVVGCEPTEEICSKTKPDGTACTDQSSCEDSTNGCGGSWHLPTDTSRILKERPVITKGTTGVFPQENITDYAAYKPYAMVTLPATAIYSHTDESKKLHDSVGGEKNHMCVPLLKAKNSNSLLQAWLMGWDPLSIARQNVVAWGARIMANSSVGPDMKKGSFAGAAYKPWHAAVPQQSRHYRWGAWAAGWDFGKPDFQIDEALHPAAFGGEKGMNKAAMARIKSTIGKAQNRTQETGSIQLTGIPAYAFGTQLVYDNAAGETVKGPFITDVSVQIGSGGLTTTYNFTTNRKFGDLTKTYEDRIRKSQRDLLANLARTEESIRRTKRGIDQYQK